MKYIFIIFAVFFLIPVIKGQDPDYDPELAKDLGADEYGMKSYVFVILKTGPAEMDDQEKINELFRGHLDNINRLTESGKLILAGPLGKNDKEYRGLFIFDVENISEAEKLVNTDPAVREKLLEAELYKWYGSAALPEYLRVHKKIEKSKP